MNHPECVIHLILSVYILFHIPHSGLPTYLVPTVYRAVPEPATSAHSEECSPNQCQTQG